MSEINLNNIPVENMSAEQRAKLLHDLQRTSSPDKVTFEPEVEPSPGGLTEKQEEQEAHDSIPKHHSNVTAINRSVTPDAGEKVVESSKGKGILNKVLRNELSLDELEVTSDIADELTEEMMNQNKAA